MLTESCFDRSAVGLEVRYTAWIKGLKEITPYHMDLVPNILGDMVYFKFVLMMN